MSSSHTRTTNDFHAQQFFMGVFLVGIVLGGMLLLGRLGGASLLTSVQSVPAARAVGTVTRTGMELTATVRAGAAPGIVRISLDGITGFGMEMAVLPVPDALQGTSVAWTIPDALFDGAAHLVYVEFEERATHVTTPLAGSPIRIGPTRED